MSANRNAKLDSGLKVWVVLLIVFALGGVTGAAIDGLYRSRSSAVPLAAGSRDGDYFERLKRELNLSTEQASEMRAIIDEMKSEYGSICAEVRPRYDELRERARLRMRALLSTEQQPRFDTIVIKEDCNSCPYLKKP